jgi:hypothetical protein
MRWSEYLEHMSEADIDTVRCLVTTSCNYLQLAEDLCQVDAPASEILVLLRQGERALAALDAVLHGVTPLPAHGGLMTGGEPEPAASVPWRRAVSELSCADGTLLDESLWLADWHVSNLLTAIQHNAEVETIHRGVHATLTVIHRPLDGRGG